MTALTQKLQSRALRSFRTATCIVIFGCSVIALGLVDASTSSASQPFTATVPAPPTLVAVTTGNGRLIVHFSLQATGGSPITGVSYSTDGGDTWSVSVSPISPMVINGLNNGHLYTVEIRAGNIVGNSGASGMLDGSPSVTPATIPSAPSITAITVGQTQLAVAFSLGSDGGSTLTELDYSTNNGATWIAGNVRDLTLISNGLVTITNLVQGTSYPVQIRADNILGGGVASSTWFATPMTSSVPSAPTIASISSRVSSTAVIFNLGNNGGSAITGIDYSVDGGTTWSPAHGTSSPLVLTGLALAHQFQIVIRAENANGASSASNLVTIETPGDPPAPLINSIVAASGTLVVNFTSAGDGGSPITHIDYSLNNGVSWISTNATTSPVTISGLANDTTYSIAVRVANSVGTGAASPIVTATTPTTPSAPLIESTEPGDRALTINFTVGNDGGLPIADIDYSTNGGVTWTPSNSSSSPILITGLSNNAKYVTEIRAENEVGAGLPSHSINASTLTTVADAILSTVSPRQSTIVANGSSSQWLSVQVVDTLNEPMGIGGSFISIKRTSGTGTLSAVRDNGDGTYSVKVTSPNSDGNGVFAATVNGTAIPTVATITYTGATAGTGGGVPGGAASAPVTTTTTSIAQQASVPTTTAIAQSSQNANTSQSSQTTRTIVGIPTLKTTTPPPVVAAATIGPTQSVVRVTIDRCKTSRCKGIIKVSVGKTTVGRASYLLKKGGKVKVTIQLNATGIKDAKARKKFVYTIA